MRLKTAREYQAHFQTQIECTHDEAEQAEMLKAKEAWVAAEAALKAATDAVSAAWAASESAEQGFTWRFRKADA